jgi:actin-related protein
MKSLYIGEEAQEKKGIKLSYPITSGIINNWEDMELIWHNTIYNELRVDPAEYGAFMTEAPLNPKVNREKMTQIFFETFKVSSFYVGIQVVLSFYASGRSSGIAVELGDGVTHTVPIYEGFSIPSAIMKTLLAGRDLSRYLLKLMTECGWNFGTMSEQEFVRKLKEDLCFMTLDYEKSMAKSVSSTEYEKEYNLPDVCVLVLDNERFRCPELLFKPELDGRDQEEIHQLVYTSIIKCDIDTRRTLYMNIVLSGGSTMFQGFEERLKKEMLESAPKAVDINIIAMPERKYSAWIGGSVLSSLKTLEPMWIKKKEYEEVEVEMVHSKCFLVVL